jgi:predicted HD phosphohydrolase
MKSGDSIMNQEYKATWTAFDNATQADWEAVMDYEAEFNAGLVDRLLAQFRLLDEEWTPYPINRYQHSLQTATRALNDGADEEMIVAALLHDIGDVAAPYNHGEVAAAILKPYVSEKTYWIVKHHPVFQGFYYNHYLGGDRNAREKYRDSPHYDDCVYFCEHYDQNAFDPAYESKPLEFFIPMLRRLFSKNPGHMELAERADDKVV